MIEVIILILEYHYIRECVIRKDVQADYVMSKDEASDIFIKPLKLEDFIRFKIYSVL